MPRSTRRAFCSSCLTRPAEVSCALCAHDSPHSCEDGFCNNAHCFRKHWDKEHAAEVYRYAPSFAGSHYYYTTSCYCLRLFSRSAVPVISFVLASLRRVSTPPQLHTVNSDNKAIMKCTVDLDVLACLWAGVPSRRQQADTRTWLSIRCTPTHLLSAITQPRRCRSSESEDSYSGSSTRMMSAPISTPTTPNVVPVLSSTLWQDRSRSPLAIRRPEWDNSSVAAVNGKQGYLSLGGQKPVLQNLDIRSKFSQHLVC